MAPDRGRLADSPTDETHNSRTSSTVDDDRHNGQTSTQRLQNRRRSLTLTDTHMSGELGCFASRSADSQSAAPDSPFDRTNFTLRGTVVGILIGIIICFSNTYFGLQTGWISGMAMPASLIGFAVFKTVSRYLVLPFTPVENVLVQTVAGAVGTMPLGLGFVGVIPSLEFLLKKSEGAPLNLDLWRLIVWGVGLCLFGVVFAVPLRKELIVREKLKFPSGTATALMISVLHGGMQDEKDGPAKDEIQTQGTEERHALLLQSEQQEAGRTSNEDQDDMTSVELDDDDLRADWKQQIRLLLISFGISGAYTLLQYFLPILHKLPIFGRHLADVWVWTLNPSPAYVGQGIIMGPATSFHMLLGAILGWAALSPIAKRNGWAPGPVGDWETGSKGWIVWVSLAIMLADALVNLGWLVLRPMIRHGPDWVRALRNRCEQSSSWKELLLGPGHLQYSSIGDALRSQTTSADNPSKVVDSDEVPEDAPPHHLVSGRTILISLPLTLAFCGLCIHLTFGAYMPIRLNVLAILLALLLSIMGVRALGETDLNPVSGISKLTQLVFALVVPSHSPNAVIVNLLAGAVSEAGALQAGDLLQDLKAGHLIGASPKAQYYGQLIGSVVGAFVSAAVYKLYVSVYTVPGDLFQIPTAFVWIFTARLVTGKGLPPMAWQYALVFGAVFVLTTSLRIYLTSSRSAVLRNLHPFIPGGIAVAVGMYNTPSFTLARAVGGAISYWWTSWKGRGETKVIVLASGLILGEGVVSIVNLLLASLSVPHL